MVTNDFYASTFYMFDSFLLPATMLSHFSELQSSLERFIKEKTIEYYDNTAYNAIESARNETLDVEDVIKKWEKLFKDVTSSCNYGSLENTEFLYSFLLTA